MFFFSQLKARRQEMVKDSVTSVPSPVDSSKSSPTDLE